MKSKSDNPMLALMHFNISIMETASEELVVATGVATFEADAEVVVPDAFGVVAADEADFLELAMTALADLETDESATVVVDLANREEPVAEGLPGGIVFEASFETKPEATVAGAAVSEAHAVAGPASKNAAGVAAAGEPILFRTAMHETASALIISSPSSSSAVAISGPEMTAGMDPV